MLISLIPQGSFIYDVHKEGMGVSKLWAISLMVMHSFGEEGLFDPVDIHTFEQKIYFFHHISNFLTIFCVLLHCFHAGTFFLVN